MIYFMWCENTSTYIININIHDNMKKRISPILIVKTSGLHYFLKYYDSAIKNAGGRVYLYTGYALNMSFTTVITFVIDYL